MLSSISVYCYCFGDIRLSCILLLLAFAAIAPGALSAAAAGLPNIEVRLKTHLTSYSSAPGSPFECVVIRPYEVDGQLVFPVGTTIYGSVARAVSVGMGLVRDRASLQLSFEEYQKPDGKRLPFDARLASIDNSRDEVSSKGVITGVLAASNPNHFIFGLWSRPSLSVFSRALIGLTGASNQLWEKFSLGPIGAVAFLGLRCALFTFPEPEIHLPPGADMQLRLKQSAAGLGTVLSPLPPETDEAISGWLRKKPYRLEKRNGRPAGDIVNIAFVGPESELAGAFSAAGWSAADRSTMRNMSRMYGAFNSMRNYAEAPVSTLLYQGTSPDLVFEKSLDTVAKRHHIRIWHAGSVDGQEIWLGAATHDTGISFDFRSLSFTHKIDANIDTERTKVETDLSFAGCSQTASRVDRVEAASSARAALGNSLRKRDAITTDGAVTVLDLQRCDLGRNAIETLPAPHAPGNRMTRLTRRIILEARNYIFRENVYYWGYQFIKRQRAEHSTVIE